MTFQIKQVGIAARRASASESLATTSTSANGPKHAITITPQQAIDRIGIVFDDSISMNGQTIIDAKKGVEEFLRNCKPNQTAVCVYPMNMPPILLDVNLPKVALAVQRIEATGNTPLCGKTIEMLERENLTRVIVFSDGQPGDRALYSRLLEMTSTKKIKIDTVFIGADYGSEFMQNLAKDTGGIFLHFDPAKSNFAESFKYLAPTFRALLADRSFVDKLEGK